MANLLELVDQLIGDVLQGNIYTNVNTYKDHVQKAVPKPYILSDPTSALNFKGPDPLHPHSSLQGNNPKQHVYPDGKLHDNRPDFLDSSPRSGIDAASTPFVKRSEIYNSSPPPDVRQKMQEVKNSIFENPPRQTLYDPATAIPPSILDQVDGMSTKSDLYKRTPIGSPPDPNLRENIYRNITSNQILPGESANPSIGDMRSAQNKPPAPSLNFRGPIAGDVPNLEELRGFKQDRAKEIDIDVQSKQFRERAIVSAGNLGDIKNNLYNDGPLSIVRGGPSALTPLRNLDVFSIAHWVRNIGSETFFLPKFGHDKDKKGRFEGAPNPETIYKSVSWLATNFLLTSLNNSDIAGHGRANAIWNPLSFPLTAISPARIVGGIMGISPTAVTIGATFSNYKMNVQASVAAGDYSPVGERLLQMRKGVYVESNPIARLQQLRSPIALPGFRGDLNGSPGDTMAQGLPSNPVNIANTIDSQTGGLQERASQLLGVHTNLYTADRPYSADNAAYPLEKLEEDFIKYNKVTPRTADDIKNSNLFVGKTWPGAGLSSPGRDTTYVAKLPSLQRRGLDATNSPEGLTVQKPWSVALNSEDETNITIKEGADEDNYMPFSFKDLRRKGSVFFRAFLRPGLNETVAPEWNEERYYGRVDAIPMYQGTTRNINLSFDMVSWEPKDLPVMYKKMQALQSMVYPMYDAQGFLKLGPIIRMRVRRSICWQQ
jgi:hypothetical protein